LNSNRNEGKKARIQALIMIIVGFVLIFCLLTATILYTVYDRSLIDFIQDFGKDEETAPEPEPEYINPALMDHSTAGSDFKDNLYIVTDAPLSNLSANPTISIKERAYYHHTISPTNFSEALFENHQHPESKITLQDLVRTNKPKYLMLNFSNAVLDLDEVSCKNFFGAILKLVKQASPDTTVIISGPIPVFSSNKIVSIKTIQRLDAILATMAGVLHEEGNDVYYLPSPSGAQFCNADGTLLDKYQDANHPGILDVTDGCWDYFNNHILQYSIPTTNSTEGTK